MPRKTNRIVYVNQTAGISQSAFDDFVGILGLPQDGIDTNDAIKKVFFRQGGWIQFVSPDEPQALLGVHANIVRRNGNFSDDFELLLDIVELDD